MMPAAEKIALSFSFNAIYFFIFLLLAVLFSVFIYRFTVPPVSIQKKTILLVLRISALVLLLFAIFEPILSLSQKIVYEPVSVIFADNSRSVLIKDGTDREKNIKEFLKRIRESELSDNIDLYSFGAKVSSIDLQNNDSLKDINFSEGSSNFSNIFSALDKRIRELQESRRNISSVVIISDGAVTEGSNPVYAAERMKIPVFAVGIGDTSRRNDIEIRNIIFNEFIYSETPTLINVSVKNTGFPDQNILLSLYENENLLEQKTLELNDEGSSNINFDYTPGTAGEKKITVRASELKGEFTYANNKKTVFLNVLDNKINVLLLSGSPSADLAFIKNNLKEDKNLDVNSITSVSQNKFIEQVNAIQLLDSSEVIFLIGFPSKETPQSFLAQVKEQLSQKNKPFFFLLSGGIDFIKLRTLQAELPFTAGQWGKDWIEVQPVISPGEKNNPLLQNNSSNNITAWENLPPVFQYYSALQAKPESMVLARIKANNNIINKPLIITNRLGSRSSIAVLGKDIWKWKLQTASKELDLFSRFIHNSVKWLNKSEEQKQVTIKTTKRIYSVGEPVEFTAQVYDQTFNPLPDAEVKVKINEIPGSEVILNSLGSGLYEGTYQFAKPGDYSFSGNASLDGKTIGSDKGRFNIGEIDIEMVNPRMDYELLTGLAGSTGGKFFYAPDYEGLFDILTNLNKQSSAEKIKTTEINLWSNEWLLTVIILLLAVEWFLRKRAGML